MGTRLAWIVPLLTRLVGVREKRPVLKTVPDHTRELPQGPRGFGGASKPRVAEVPRWDAQTTDCL